jgi:hypothetical protein
VIRLTLWWLTALACAHAADICPGPANAPSYKAKSGQKWCVANSVEAKAPVQWPAAGIEHADAAGRLDVQVCCFRHVSSGPRKLTIGNRETQVETHHESPKAAGKEEEEDEFPDLIEDDAHGRAISIRGLLGDGARVDVLLRCTASRFADQYAFQFTVVNRSDKGVDVDWDHLRELRATASPNVQPVAGGMAYVFLTAKRPREALAVVEIKRGGVVLGRFQFDGFTVR